jgi:hypothetical protein
MLLLQGFAVALVVFLALKILGWFLRRNREQHDERRYLQKLAWSARSARETDPDLFFSNSDD